MDLIRNWQLLLATILFSTGCYHPEKIDSPVHKPIILSHAGKGVNTFLGLEVPNTLNAIRHQIRKHRADGVEIDVQVTHDGVAVLYHDEDLSDATHCHGNICQSGYDHIRDCRYRNFIPGLLGKSRRITTLGEVIQWSLAQPEPPLLDIEIKIHPACSDPHYLMLVAQSLERELEDYPDASLIIESRHQGILPLVKQRNPSWRVFYTHDNLLPAIRFAFANQLDGIVIDVDSMDVNKAGQLYDMGLSLILWNVNSANALSRAVALQPMAIQTTSVINVVEHYN